MKHVPDNRKATDSTAPSRDEQLKALREKLAGHQAFGRIRGHWHQSLLEITARLLHDTASPTAFCAAWDQCAADVRIIGNLLAQLRRDGWTDAEQELQASLRKEGRLMEGEVLPLHETVPATALVFDPKRTFALLRWLRAVELSEFGAIQESKFAAMFTNCLLDRFPSLREPLERNPTGIGLENELASTFLQEIGDRWMSTERFSPSCALRLNFFNSKPRIEGLWIGYLLIQDQAEVLSAFSRKEQKSLATWQCRIPKILCEPTDEKYPLHKISYQLKVGFHSESDHVRVKRLAPTTSSAGCSHGYGVRIFTPYDKRYANYMNELDRSPENIALLLHA